MLKKYPIRRSAKSDFLKASIEIMSISESDSITETNAQSDIFVYVLFGKLNISICQSRFLIHRNYFALCPFGGQFSLSSFGTEEAAFILIKPDPTVPQRISSRFGIKELPTLIESEQGSLTTYDLTGFYPISNISVRYCKLQATTIVRESDVHLFFLNFCPNSALSLTFDKYLISHRYMEEDSSLELSVEDKPLCFLSVQFI